MCNKDCYKGVNMEKNCNNCLFMCEIECPIKIEDDWNTEKDYCSKHTFKKEPVKLPKKQKMNCIKSYDSLVLFTREINNKISEIIDYLKSKE